MKSRHLAAEVPGGRGKNVPTLDEIHRRAHEIHVERGDHGCDLDDWLQAERELQEKHNENNGAGPKNK